MNIKLPYRLLSVKILFFLIAFFITSCDNESRYKIILDDYVREDIAINENRKAYELASLKVLAEERPREFESMYKEADNINIIISRFERFLLQAEDVGAINSELRFVREEIKKLNLKHYAFLEKGFDIEPLKASSDKYDLMIKLNNLNFDSYNLLLSMGCDLSGISSFEPQLLASRLNDSVVVLNVYSRLLRDYDRFVGEKPSLNVKINNEVNASKYIGFYIKPQTSSAAYLIKSKSDTIFVDALIKSNDFSKRIVSKNSSYINVGELKAFDENYLSDFFKKTYN